MFTRYLKKFINLRTAFIVGLACVIAGAVVIGANILNFKDSGSTAAAQPLSQVLKSEKVVDNGNPTISGIPVHIDVPSVSISLNVIPGYYYSSSKTWTLSLSSAQYAVMTAPANNKSGDTFIYAHYRKGLFLTLPKIQPGATALVTTSNGHVFTYTFRASTVTTPEDTSLFSYQGKPILILQTCSGSHFQNRQLFTFDLTKVD
jgi:LPXTG-site transpeptidase (sortase) family protein